jgi:hypothetical protein
MKGCTSDQPSCLGDSYASAHYRCVRKPNLSKSRQLMNYVRYLVRTCVLPDPDEKCCGVLNDVIRGATALSKAGSDEADPHKCSNQKPTGKRSDSGLLKNTSLQ